MRRFDKTKNMLNANLLAEQRYLASKGLIKEVYDNYDNTADRAGESGINQYDDEKYDEMQKLKNLPNDNIIYNIEQNGKEITFSFDSNDTGTAEVKVLGDNDGEVIATYYFELKDLEDLDDRPWVGLADASLGDNANISALAQDYITDMIEKGDDLVQKHSEYVNGNPRDKGGPESDRAESEYLSNNDY